jgi:hypothetical protein
LDSWYLYFFNIFVCNSHSGNNSWHTVRVRSLSLFVCFTRKDNWFKNGIEITSCYDSTYSNSFYLFIDIQVSNKRFLSVWPENVILETTEVCFYYHLSNLIFAILRFIKRFWKCHFLTWFDHGNYATIVTLHI